MSVGYFLSFIGRLIYNLFSRRKIDLDLWMAFDVVAGIINITAFNIVGNARPESILDVDKKRGLDYYMILVLIVSWLRFFSYFLVVRIISKLTITLFSMLKEVLPFMIILACYSVLTTTMFATLFRDVETEDADNYKELFHTFVQLFDYFIGNYVSKDMANFNTSHSILYMVHVFISNIFLMNFIVAILTTVYTIMVRNGDFYAIEY